MRQYVTDHKWFLVIHLFRLGYSHIVCKFVALDRKEKGLAEHSAIQELAANLQVPVEALVDIDDLIGYLADDSSQYQDATQLAKMQHYRAQYGVV